MAFKNIISIKIEKKTYFKSLKLIYVLDCFTEFCSKGNDRSVLTMYTTDTCECNVYVAYPQYALVNI